MKKTIIIAILILALLFCALVALVNERQDRPAENELGTPFPTLEPEILEILENGPNNPKTD